MNFGLRYCRAKACLSTTTHPPNCFCLRDLATSVKKYRRFATAAEAIPYAVEGLPTPNAFGAWHQNRDLAGL